MKFPNVSPLDPSWYQRAAAHQAQLTMPEGALGRLLPLAQQLCAIQESLQPHCEPAAVAVLAGDHGVVEEGVSPFPQEVTGQMVSNFLSGGAGINVLARRMGAKVVIADLGVRHLPEMDLPDLIRKSCGPGTNNFLHRPAMALEQVHQALQAGREIVDLLVNEGVRVIVLGEMGIGNTTSSSALASVFTGKPVSEVTGRGAGIDQSGWERKCSVIERAIELHSPDLGDPVAALAALGGFEIAGLAGAAIQAAHRRCVVLLDGFICSTAALVASHIVENTREYFIAGHSSVEKGHRAVLEDLKLKPLLDLGLRLGEGTGAALALSIVQAAADIMRDMATFESAGVSANHGENS